MGVWFIPHRYDVRVVPVLGNSKIDEVKRNMDQSNIRVPIRIHIWNIVLPSHRNRLSNPVHRIHHRRFPLRFDHGSEQFYFNFMVIHEVREGYE